MHGQLKVAGIGRAVPELEAEDRRRFPQDTSDHEGAIGDRPAGLREHLRHGLGITIDRENAHGLQAQTDRGVGGRGFEEVHEFAPVAQGQPAQPGGVGAGGRQRDMHHAGHWQPGGRMCRAVVEQAVGDAEPFLHRLVVDQSEKRGRAVVHGFFEFRAKLRPFAAAHGEV